MPPEESRGTAIMDSTHTKFGEARSEMWLLKYARGQTNGHLIAVLIRTSPGGGGADIAKSINCRRAEYRYGTCSK